MQPGEKTSELFTKVKIPEWFTESDRENFAEYTQIKDENGNPTGEREVNYRFDVLVTAEAIQTADSFVDSDPVEDVTDKDYYKAFEAFDQEKAAQSTIP